jgi:outer membrane protein insertion porin family
MSPGEKKRPTGFTLARGFATPGTRLSAGARTMRLVRVYMGLLLLIALARAAGAQGLPAAAPEAPYVDHINIVGNRRVEDEAIRVQLRMRPGARLDLDTVDEDIRALYKTGFFDNVEADFVEANGVGTLTYRLTERPFIGDVRVEGNKKLNKEEIEAALKVRPNTILDPEKIRRGIEDAKKEYEKKGYLDAVIKYDTEPMPEGEVRLVYKVTEGNVVRVADINFEGANAFSSRQLRAVMETKEKSILSFVTGAGNLDSEKLKTDVERLTAFYYDNGYIDVKIDQPVITREKEGVRVAIKIDEGPQYKVGTVDIGGDLLPAPELDAARKKLALHTGEVFRTSKLRDDINTLTDAYGDQGYAFVNVAPDTVVNQTERVVNVSYKVSEGPLVYIDKIEITGNTKTRDKVIRREMALTEQERFSGTKLRRSQEKIRRLGFFEEVNVTTRKSEKEDRLDVLVDVKEASTGAFSAGAGVSSGENYLFNVRLSEINFLGRGQRVVFNLDFGDIRQNFTLDFSDPYFLDSDVAFGTSAYRWRIFYEDFTRAGTGGTLRLFYPLNRMVKPLLYGFSLEDARLGLEYRLEQADISDVSSTASTDIRAEQGTSVISAITPRFYRDTRNHPFDPTAGSVQDVGFSVAGLGGDAQFVKFESRGRWYLPFWKSPQLGTFIYSPAFNFDYGVSYGEYRELPLFERYFPGGINSIRGFKIFSLGPQTIVSNQFGQDVARDRIGGSQQLITNQELIFPIVESLGLKGVLFFDAGNAFTAARGINFSQMRMSAGPGIRWQSPMGPLRIELGFALNKKDGDQTQVFGFTFGAPL